MKKPYGVLALSFALLAVGCAHRPVLNTYRLVRQDNGPVLVPPEVAGPELAQRTLVADVERGAGPCVMESGPIRLDVRKKKVRVTVDRVVLDQQKQPGWLSDWSTRMEAQGCIAAGGSQRLGRSIVESVPLDSLVSYRLLHANDVQHGYVELGPENRLEVRSAILREGTAADAPIGEVAGVSGEGPKISVDLKLSSSVMGFETAWYGIQPNSAGAGYRIVPLSAERNIQGRVEQAAGPATNYFPVPPQAAFFRLFYKRDDNGVTAIVICGATRPDLDSRTKIVGADPDACGRERGMCVVLPKRVGVNPFLTVSVNGRDLTLPLSATVRNAITAAGVRSPESVLPQLTVARPFGRQSRAVEFDRHAQDILNLKLAGGEVVTWVTP